MTIAFQKALKNEGINGSEEEILSLLKQSSKHALAYYNLDESFKKKWKAIEERVDKEMSQPFQGVLEVLKLIVNNAGENYIVTHRDKTTFEYLEYHGMLQYFTDVITIEKANQRKPHTDLFDQIIAKNKIISNECLSIGDRILDMIPSKTLGLKTCLYNPKGLNHKVAVDYEIKEYKRLEEILRKNFNG
jgi:FMN phosphatase YigB (HAD superfamily)